MPSKTSSNPRRRAASPSTTAALIDSFAGLSLKKGTTFHSPSSNKSQLFNPLDKAADLRSMTARSTTSPKALEDLLIGAGERRAADLLSKVDQVIADNTSAAALGKLLSEPETLPNPRCILDDSALEDISEERRDSPNNAYDSGLGSSIADSDEFDIKKAETSTKASTLGATPSISTSHADDHLSEFACEQIHNYIVKPILRQQALKDFHPLVRGVPRRIGKREITTLRDLEKTLIFLAPDYSRSPSAYLNFCETYIDCLHATVDIVHESDHCSPSDRPYTNNYFLDLVGQIRRYAQIVAATRTKQQKGEQLDELDVTMDERLELRGGVTHKTPVQLVRHRQGKDISLLDGSVLSTSSPDPSTLSSKRPIMEDTLDDGVERSMARRRKGEPIKTYECGVGSCEKTFRRPCDRTKHMKTHERPWKCPHTDCKYHVEGWPTEKECERHVNDKHAESPVMYACYWSTLNNCPYQSKRLSNCKSHMEKAHGWSYVRSKTVTKNGKAKVKSDAKEPTQQPIKLINGVPASASPSSSSGLDTPLMQVDQLPVSHMSAASSSRQGSLLPSIAQPTIMTPFESPEFSTTMDFQPEFTGHFNFDFNFGNGAFATNQFPYTPSLTDDRRPSHTSSATGTAPNSTLIQGETSFDDALAIPLTPEDTPPFTSMLDGFKFNQNNPADSGFISDQSLLNDMLSPHAQPVNGGNLTFTAPQALAAEGFGGDVLMNNDFDMSNYLPGNYSNDSLFPETNDFGLGAQFDEPSNAEVNNPYAQYFPELN